MGHFPWQTVYHKICLPVCPQSSYFKKQPAVEKKRTKDVDSPTMNVAFGKLI